MINKITLNNTEIEKAIENYVRTLISIAPGQKIVIDMKAGRGENGYSATLDILPADTVEQQTLAQIFKDVTDKGREAISSLAKIVNEDPAPELTAEKPAPKPVSTRKPFAGLGAPKTSVPITAIVTESGEIIEPEQAEEIAGISSGEDRGEADQTDEVDETAELPEEAAPAPKITTRSIFSKAS